MELSKELVNGLTGFLVTNIESKALDGITYVMAFKNDKELIEDCKHIKEEAIKNGFNNDQCFRIYELVNGYIFDMDLSVAKFLTKKLYHAVTKDQNGSHGDLIGDRPEQRRREDMKKLAKYCKSQYEKGIQTFEVALFSRNSVPRIVVSGSEKGPGNKGNGIIAQYNAFAIRHWDIEEINATLLGPIGLKISKIKPCEILPPKTGVRFEITVTRA